MKADDIPSVGVYVTPLLPEDSAHVLTGVTVTPTGRTHKLATTQDHFAIDAVGFEAIGARLDLPVSAVISDWLKLTSPEKKLVHVAPATDSETIHTHISSPTQLLSIFGALLGLTALTVWAASWPVGNFDVWIALGIAGVKGGLVAACLMHLRYDRPTNSLLLIFSIATVVLFLSVTLADILQLVPEVEAAAPPTGQVQIEQ